MSYKVYYFNFRGLAEPIRFMLKYNGTEFEDVRIERENWPEWKDSKYKKSRQYSDKLDVYEYFVCLYSVVPYLESLNLVNC